ncbi:hypothetical protein M011DRAFT_486434 [Sporormia fimetaria CBS 119925]|uniref:Uncharacterized protein n=1 Tax=Sporormia fimetaria CBS 119925 TaxID=1340428 RepID=A0A6A6VD11_9PLEO|nr:hypothetical protein M011DRAFT_486434 [Sporormia fimetaria CBS 119925]
MQSIANRIAFRSAFRARPLLTTASRRKQHSMPLHPTHPDREREIAALKRGAQRNPELYVLFVVMSSAFALAGWHFSRHPTSASSERPVTKIPDTEPWHDRGAANGPYQFAPYGDLKNGARDAPSAINETIIPNVTLPKKLHERWNKYGKEGY